MPVIDAPLRAVLILETAISLVLVSRIAIVVVMRILTVNNNRVHIAVRDFLTMPTGTIIKIPVVLKVPCISTTIKGVDEVNLIVVVVLIDAREVLLPEIVMVEDSIAFEVPYELISKRVPGKRQVS